MAHSRSEELAVYLWFLCGLNNYFHLTQITNNNSDQLKLRKTNFNSEFGMLSTRRNKSLFWSAGTISLEGDFCL